MVVPGGYYETLMKNYIGFGESDIGALRGFLNGVKCALSRDMEAFMDNKLSPVPEEYLQIKPIGEIKMDQNDSIDDKKPKKKRVSNIVYYVIYIFIHALILATVFFLY